ncbi:sec-independent protein translocase protein TatB [Candidatus Thermokryptus mobilis]|uniref:Sec-independent protein translocase protein TatA n=1 Tax=Candidatus Thermokryptus mobilis TaxID=1643428 RepID=A0A0S4N9Q6_9BACT|nr:twin-arginine translocase TatA/TatE family subunit [Candidatus Thermokryptus mobilis]CUU07717.1 sec-independent protein translocase protein TatB [Candidatus Thermokryptus mobilis]
MFDNIGFGELLVIALFILIFFGPKKIPDIARSLGRAIREFRKAMQDVQSEIQSVTGIDIDGEISSVSEQPKIEAPKDLDDLKFSKDENLNERKVESVNLGFEEKDVRLDKSRKKSRMMKEVKKSSGRVKTKSKRK